MRSFAAMQSRESDILEQYALDGRVPADLLVGVPREQQELAVRERAPFLAGVGERQRKLPHELHRRRGLDDTLEPGPVRQRAEQAQQVEIAVAPQRERRGDATRGELRIGIGKEQVVRVGRGARARDAGVDRMDLAGPIGRARIDFDELEALVVGDGRAGERRRVVRAPIQREHHPQLRIRLGTQRPHEFGR